MRLLFILLLISNLSVAIEVPNDFFYQGKPIDPNCILKIHSKDNVNLEECSHDNDKLITNNIVHEHNIGYRYIYKKNNMPGSISYQYLGKIAKAHVVHTIAIGGEISRLNYISFLNIDKNNLLLIKAGPSGDRSNGGIFNAKIKNNALEYDKSVTAKLFMTIFNKAKTPILELNELPNCAICQFALIHYIDNKITSIKINKEALESANNPYAECFSQMHKSLIKRKKLILNEKEATAFVDEFHIKCLK
jgi:hypothetical protein